MFGKPVVEKTPVTNEILQEFWNKHRQKMVESHEEFQRLYQYTPEPVLILPILSSHTAKCDTV